MAEKIKEVEHTKTGGFDPLLTLVTAGAGAVSALDPVRHEVIIERESGSVGVGHGSTYSEARTNAIKDSGK
jgi:hypothetical protein